MNADAGETLSPDERTLSAHLRGARFQAGVDAGRWRLVEMAWPHAVIAVSAAPREEAPAEFLLRFHLAGYPQEAPTACPWDPETNERLAPGERPKGLRVGHVFRTDWEDGSALYAPWDRVALNGHNWAAQHPRFAWHARREITFYLENVHELLNDNDYLGV